MSRHGDGATRAVLLAPAIALGLCAVWILVLAIPGGWLLFVLFVAVPLHALPDGLVVLPWLAIGLCIAVAAELVGLKLGWRLTRWSVCASGLASTAMLAAIVLYPSLSNSPATMASRWVDLAFYRHELDAMVRQQHRAGQSPGLAVIAIDGLGSIVCGVAYDESGEIALPAGEQSSRWQAAAAGGELDRDAWTATRLYGNYFWWDAQ